MHFKLDENIPLQLKNLLTNHNQSVSSVFSEKISGIKDKDLLEICNKNNFILITLDNDFASYSSHKGIILMRLKSQGSLSVINAFENFIKNTPLERCRDSFIIIEDKYIRIR